MPEHRVELVQLLDPTEQGALLGERGRLTASSLESGNVDQELLTLREELVERRVDGADRDRSPRIALNTP